MGGAVPQAAGRTLGQEGAGLPAVPGRDGGAEIQGKTSENNYQEKELEGRQVFSSSLRNFSLKRIWKGEKNSIFKALLQGRVAGDSLAAEEGPPRRACLSLASKPSSSGVSGKGPG